ncbi:MAG: hypothetical protein ACI91B_003609 [Planctomycetota bacterium]|jgi:hypothetical protein
MMRSLLSLTASAAAYGFSIGISNSWTYAMRNLVKFPLLILSTAAICALLYHVLARFLDARFDFMQVQRLVLGIFRDISRLLAALSPAVCFLGVTMQRPNGRDLGGYPQFLLLNVFAIAICGCLSVYLRSRDRVSNSIQMPKRRHLLIACWMAASLAVGGQVCWMIRPFFGTSGAGSWETPWFSGANPDKRGASNFYIAVYYLIVPPKGWK